MADQLVSGSLGAANAFVYVPLTQPGGTLQVQIYGGYSATLSIQTSPDYINWTTVPNSSIYPVGQSGAWGSGAQGMWTAPVSGKYARVICQSFASGLANVNLTPLYNVIPLAVQIPKGCMARMMALGDSLTDTAMADRLAGGVATYQTVAPGWGMNPTAIGPALAKNCYLVRSCGVFGNTSRQIAARLVSQAMTVSTGLPLGNVIHILAGTNDQLNSITVNETISNVMWMVRQCISRGYLPIVGTLPPRSDYAYGSTWTALHNHILAFNAWALATLPPLGVPVIDYYAYCADASGNWVGYGTPGGTPPASSYSSDGVHWNNPPGAVAGGMAAAAVLSQLPFPRLYLAQQDWLLAPNNEVYASFYEHPLLLNNATAWSNTQGTGAWATASESSIPASGAAPGFYYDDNGNTVSTFTIEPGTLPNGAFSPGNWFKDVASGSGTGFSTNYSVASDRNWGNPPADARSVAVGASHLLYYASRVSLKGCALNNCAFQHYVNFTGASAGAAANWCMDTPVDMIIAQEFKMPAGTQTALESYMMLNGNDGVAAWSGTLCYSQPTMVDLTASSLTPGTNW